MESKRLRECAALYFGDRAIHWKGLDDLGRRLEANGHGLRSYLALAHRERGGDAYENAVCGMGMYELYETRLPIMESEAQMTTEIDFQIYKRRQFAGGTPRSLLADDQLPVSPLFRYVMSVIEGFYDIAQRMAPKAAQQVMENPYYVAAWPEELLKYFPKTDDEEVPDEQG